MLRLLPILLLLGCGAGDNVDLPHFADLPLRYYIDADVPEAYRIDIHRGIKLWDLATVEHTIEFGGVDDWREDKPRQHALSSPGVSVISATNEPYRYFDYDKKEIVTTDYVAVAMPYTAGDRPVIVECDIYLFEFDKNFVKGRNDYTYDGRTVDLAVTVAHEMGHCFGLGHSDEPSDLMFATNHLRFDALGWDWKASRLGDGDNSEFQLRYMDLTFF